LGGQVKDSALCNFNRDSLLKHVNEGKVVVIDRYAYSGAAFTAAKGLDLEWCKGPDKGLPKPDIVIYLNLSTNEASKRGGFGHERYEKVEFQEKVKHQFENLVEKDWVIIDASRNEDDISQEIRDLILKIWELPRSPLQSNLWC